MVVAYVIVVIFFLISFGGSIQIETKYGLLKGKTEKSRGGRDFFSFYGIPYAEPPIGNLRFEEPVPRKSWEGVWDATILPPACIYRSPHGQIIGKEDCLYLNLYTPNVQNKSLLPVMVFVYGGRFMFGDALPGRYGPHYFMDKDIILITFHYRQGPFGFLSTEDEIMPGNYGFKDFIAVLRWIQENVESFGGDKNRVTVAGGSSGGVTTGLTLVSPLAKGLFHRCISQSGYLTDVESPGMRRNQTWTYASFVGCENVVTSEDLKSCMKKIPADVMASHNNKLEIIRDLKPVYPYGPVIENEKIPGAFLVDQPTKLLGRNTDIPWLLGMNSAEEAMVTIFLYFNFNSDRRLIERISENFHEYLPALLLRGVQRDILKNLCIHNLTKIIKQKYFGYGEIIDNPQDFTRLYTDIFSLSLKQAIELYKGPKYLYYYDHKNKESFAKFYGRPTEDMGVIHGDELISMFNWSEVITPVTEGVDLVVSEQLLDLWTNFAAHGNPNGKGEKLWKPAELSRKEYLYIKDGVLEMRTDLQKSNFEYWDRILRSHKIKPTNDGNVCRYF